MSGSAISYKWELSGIEKQEEIKKLMADNKKKEEERKAQGKHTYFCYSPFVFCRGYRVRGGREGRRRKRDLGGFYEDREVWRHFQGKT